MEDPSPARPPRQATACNWCREHKLKCDTEQPSCRNCRKRDIECVTTNLRRPDQSGRRLQPKGRRISRKSVGNSSSASNLSLSQTRTDSTSTHPSPSVSPSPPPSPSQQLLATFNHDSNVPSIFATPFEGSDNQRRSPSVSQLNRSRREREDGGNYSNHASTDRIRNSSTQDNSNVIVVTDRSRSRLQVVGSGSSIYVMTQWLDLFFSKSDFWQPIYPFFQQGLAFSVEVPLPFLSSLPQFPSADVIDKYLTTFFTRIYPIYPIIDREYLHESISALRHKLDHRNYSLTSRDYPALACIYAVFSLAADEFDGSATDTGTHFLEGAYFLYAHLVAMPYVPSVQALLLITIILRHRNKDAACLGTLGQAIRIAQSIGLHRRVTTAESLPAVVDLHARIWWTAYIMERSMELETGRPSAIRDSECDQVMPQKVLEMQPQECSFDYFGALIKLAQIQNHILDLYYNKQQVRRTKELLHEMGKLDRSLLDWTGTFPEEIR